MARISIRVVKSAMRAMRAVLPQAVNAMRRLPRLVVTTGGFAARRWRHLAGLFPRVLQGVLTMSRAAVAPVAAALGLLIAVAGVGISAMVLHSVPADTSPSRKLGMIDEPHGIDGGAIVDLRDPPDMRSSDLLAPGASLGSAGIPFTVLAAYQHATEQVNRWTPQCHLPMALLAAIGRVESGHANGGDVDARGVTQHPILGPELDGTGGRAAIPAEPDDGRFTGDTKWERAVGPMQFLPSTWHRWGVDGNQDRVADPSNVFDAALGGARYLCAAGGDLSTPGGLRNAILAYNHSEQYLAVVSAWMRVYATGVIALPNVVLSGVGAQAPAPRSSSAPPLWPSSPQPSSPPQSSSPPPTSGPPPGEPSSTPLPPRLLPTVQPPSG